MATAEARAREIIKDPGILARALGDTLSDGPTTAFVPQGAFPSMQALSGSTVLATDAVPAALGGITPEHDMRSAAKVESEKPVDPFAKEIADLTKGSGAKVATATHTPFPAPPTGETASATSTQPPRLIKSGPGTGPH